MRHRPGKTNRRGGRRGVDVPIGSQPIGSAPGMRMTSSSVVCRAEGPKERPPLPITRAGQAGARTTREAPPRQRLRRARRRRRRLRRIHPPCFQASTRPGSNASQWYALTLGCVALASFLASKLDVHDERTARAVAAPVVAGMTAYHLGISAFQVRRVATMGAVPVAVGALCVHGGLTIAFAVAAAYVLRPRSSS